jgi:hypothetical protein
MMMIELTPCDVCGDLMSADVHAEELGMCLECSNLYFAHDADGHECSWGCLAELPETIKKIRGGDTRATR